MTDPARGPEEPRFSEEPHNNAALWLVVGLMALIAVGGLAYGLSYPSLHASHPPQTTGSGAGHPL
jgi:hypothetical protein